MKTIIDEILALHRQKGQEMAASGQWRIAGNDRADDVLSAVHFLQDLLQAFPGSGTIKSDFEAVIQLIEDNRAAFETSHWDPDGFGTGTITDIVNALREKSAQ
ncbi:MAG: hypothetical protein GY869_14140 [Planctomycetes bacterium]|nr:hypothetical protein [Planctomycetota bacterium]